MAMSLSMPCLEVYLYIVCTILVWVLQLLFSVHDVLINTSLALQPAAYGGGEWSGTLLLHQLQAFCQCCQVQTGQDTQKH